MAQEWRLTRKADALCGEVLRKKDQSTPVRFESFVTEYLEKWTKLKKKESTYTRDRYSTERLKAVFGSRMLSEIRRRDIEEYVAQRLTAGRSPATVNRELCCLKNMLRKAVDWEYIEKNPAWGVKQQRESPPEFEFLLPDEIERLIAAYTPELQALALSGINTGM